MRAPMKALSILAGAACAGAACAAGLGLGASAETAVTNPEARAPALAVLASHAPQADEATSSSLGTSSPVAGDQFSGTNDQEPGVDEPDVAKTNGQLMVVLRHEPLGVQVVDVATSPPSLGGFVRLSRLSEATGLFLVGDKAVVVGERISPVVLPAKPAKATTPAKAIRPAKAPEAPATAAHPAKGATRPDGTGAPAATGPTVPLPLGNVAEAYVVNLSEPAAPEVVGHFDFRGQLLGARLIGGEVVLVLSNTFLPPLYAGSQTSAPGRWLGEAALGPQASRPYRLAPVVVEPAVASTVSVVALNPTSGRLGKEVTVRVVGAEALGGVVYATATQLFVAAEQLRVVPCCPLTAQVACPVEKLRAVPTEDTRGPQAVMCPLVPASSSLQGGGPLYSGAAETAYPIRVSSASTKVVGFDISDPAVPVYLGSADVPGALNNQYALSAYDGYLRVVTTVSPAVLPAVTSAPAAQLGTRVTVLQPAAGALVTVALLSGLSPGGYLSAVTFQGPFCYLVTYSARAIPVATIGPASSQLTVVDLSDPAKPTVVGRVGLPGLPSLLQALGGGLLVALGQPGRSGGLQLEVLDVAAPAAPALASRHVIGTDASSLATSDHHALLWWPANRLLVFPVSRYASLRSLAITAEAEAWAVGASGEASLAGTVTQPAASGPVTQPVATGPLAAGPIGTQVVAAQAVAAQAATQPVARHPVARQLVVTQPVGRKLTTQPAQPTCLSAPVGIEEALVVGPNLFTVSDVGVLAADLTSFARVAWLPYPAEQPGSCSPTIRAQGAQQLRPAAPPSNDALTK
jgi:uncharacterized secreted protein with C-terminal beta-propeller domain